LTTGGRRADNALVGLGLFAREWERTCSECGYTWRVPRSIARRGIRGMSAITVRGATAGRMTGTSDVGALSADIEARADLMEGFRTCAKCGADDFTQRPCRRGETATTELPPPEP
jgi:predicted nucleic-acid-binding Zn-ribbon protein